MKHHYSDIRDEIPSEPKWWDEHGVPRYCTFTPNATANIYAAEAVLLLIECQSCRTPFKVCMTANDREINWYKTKEGEPVVCYPTMAESVKDLHYGDPPNAGCCPAGPTMNSIPRRVLEFWRRDHEWERVPALEVDIDCDWMDDDDAAA